MSTFDYMTKKQLIARLIDRERRVSELFEEKVQLKKELNAMAEYAGNILSAAYSFGITEEQMVAAMKRLRESQRENEKEICHDAI